MKMRDTICLPGLMLGKNKLFPLFYGQKSCILGLIGHVTDKQKSKRPCRRLLLEKEAIGQDAENKSGEEGVFPIPLRQCKV